MNTPNFRMRDKLNKRAAALREEIRQTLLRTDQERYSAIAEEIHDTATEAFANLLVDVNLAEIDRDLGELRDVEAALQRFSRGTYGNCIDCGEPIQPARLAVNPAASRCAACQIAYERRSLRKSARP